MIPFKLFLYCHLRLLNYFQTIMVKFILKSGKEELEIEHAENQKFQDFQAKVYSLTSIPPKNLKVLFKGGMIKDNKSLFGTPLDAKLVIMGTKEGKQLKQTSDLKVDTIMVEEPKKQQKFGLVNIGNTCYMNSSIQFLKSIPKINTLLRTFKSTNNNIEQNITKNLSYVIKEMEKKDVSPQLFVGHFLNAHPEFQPFGTQQDADQFMQRLIQDISATSPENGKALRQQFEVQLENTLKNTEIPEQPPVVTLQTTTKIGCSLGGNEKETKVGTLLEGIKFGLRSKVQKKSQIDNHDHIYQSESKFSSLPAHLIVQMIRFFWKEVNEPDTQFNKSQATKICRVIDFGARLDLFDYCTDELKKKLQKGREAYEQNKKREEEEYKKQFEAYKQSMGQTNRPETRLAEEFKQKWKSQQKVLSEGLETGVYEISAVVTHLGHSVESGHYMAWVKESEYEWIKYDDNTVYPQPQQKVFQLRGGQPNLEIAYLLLFRKVLTKPL